MINAEQNIISVILITSDNCDECNALENKLRKLMDTIICFKLNVLKMNEFNSSKGLKIFITSALIVNGKLQFYGDVPENKLYKILSKQINK